MSYSKTAPKSDQNLIARARAARGIVEATQSEAVTLAGFMALFHPDYPEEKTRAMINDAKERDRRRRR